MSDLVQRFDVTPSLINQINQEGAVVLRQLFTSEAIKAFEKAALDLSVPPDHDGDNSFKRLAYGDGPPSKIITALCRSTEFSRIIGRLTGQHQVATNMLSFELTPADKGSEWHFGRRSFCFVGPEVASFTLWIPLTPVREEPNGGGLIWAPQDMFSAYSRIQQWTMVFRSLGKIGGRDFLSAARLLQFGPDGDPWTGPFDEQILEAAKHPDQDFDPGDALLFSRNVWHRTSRLKSADLPNRKAIVIRFSDGRSFLDKKCIEGVAKSLRPKADNFLTMLMDADETVALAAQPFATSLAESEPLPESVSS
ncbi:MAG: hypothetical protein J0J06_12870 [Sphingomonas sp.]|uniref:hypothetical protein n=1 Tax=Sphingomonas sp. TaxID=28214 RepID=UPI001AC9FADF|nr:hypothetical protein [Sphingomonas sp.]MBN8816325.1 hypothetical protein [Sphingomonas sp.]